MKVIIIILQAILNLVRKRRDLIANRSKIPPEYRDDVVVWYSPKKQRLTNYDVIESYAEDFTYWTLDNTGITSTPKKIVIPAGTELNSPRGKELLEKQLNNIRTKKDSIIEEANKELELFKKFQIAAQANPKLTYVDFCNNIKNKEV